jgi:6-phosphogluconate dehydrogenase
LAPLFEDDTEFINPLYNETITNELKKAYPALKRIVSIAIEYDQVIPSLSATLEYLKYMSNTDLPTSFYEAELDYFGSHMYDKKGEDEPGKPETGKHHFEWKPA